MQTSPLVSIGIPTYNRSTLLKRTIDSALNQTYRNIEIIISDNASPDNTEVICQQITSKNKRVRYFKQKKNIGPTNNFIEVLKLSQGEYFMWLGDDDWIDENYVNVCIDAMCLDPDLSLVCGKSQYYINGEKTFAGKTFDLSHVSAWLRIIAYYAKVTDNGMFYGIMRKNQIQQVELQNIMGGDWLMIACIVFLGKAKVLTETSVHRELGGATVSYAKIASTLGLPKFQAMFPMFSVAINSWKDIVIREAIFMERSPVERFFVGGIVFLVIILKIGINYIKSLLRWLKKKITHIYLVFA